MSTCRRSRRRASRPARRSRPHRPSWPCCLRSEVAMDDAGRTPLNDEPPDDIEDAPRRPRRKGIYILPNLFTLAALFGGFYGIVMAMNGRFENAAIGIFLAAVLDSLDGRVARMTNTQS